jgi:hypothetical protein
MGATYFQEGDRVRVRVARGPLKVGMVGTIVRVYDFVVDAYLVQLDDQADPHHM